MTARLLQVLVVVDVQGAVDAGKLEAPRRGAVASCGSFTPRGLLRSRGNIHQGGVGMRSGKTVKVGAATAVLLLAVIGIAWAKGDWSAARSKSDDFKSRHQELRKLAPEETRRVVSAICEADEDARKDAGRDASDRVARSVSDKLSDLERVRNDAFKLLDEVIGDDDLKDNRDDAKRLREEVGSRWDSIERMSRSLRGANHPVVTFMLDQGQRAHAERQRDCDASEVVLDSGRADCVMATGETCTVIELKPQNSRAISKGVDQYRRYVRDLNEQLKKPGSEVIKKLIDRKSDFAKCKSFDGRIDCYKLCPEISDDNEFREVRADWKRDCS